MKQMAANPNQNKRIAEIVRGVLIALPILALFTLLLSSADSVFQGMVGESVPIPLHERRARSLYCVSSSYCCRRGLSRASLLHTLRRQPTVATPQTNSGPSTVPLTRRGISYVEGALVLMTR